MFEYRFIRFQYDHLNHKFMPIIFNCNLPYQTIHAKFNTGISNKADYKMKLIKYGRCDIDIPIKSIPRLLIEEIINPFYVF